LHHGGTEHLLCVGWTISLNFKNKDFHHGQILLLTQKSLFCHSHFYAFVFVLSHLLAIDHAPSKSLTAVDCPSSGAECPRNSLTAVDCPSSSAECLQSLQHSTAISHNFSKVVHVP
jgi:hypothetical protein